MKRQPVSAVDLEKLEDRMWRNTGDLVRVKVAEVYGAQTRITNMLVGNMEKQNKGVDRKLMVTWLVGLVVTLGWVLAIVRRPVVVRYANYPQCHEIISPTVEP